MSRPRVALESPVPLIQSQLSALPRGVPGLVVMLPHLKRLDVYTTLGVAAEETDEFLRTLLWVSVEQTGNGWTCREVDADLRDTFLAAAKRGAPPRNPCYLRAAPVERGLLYVLVACTIAWVFIIWGLSIWFR